MSSLNEKMLSPSIRRALKVSEKSGVDVVTYNSVIRKSALFLLTFVLGAIIAIVVHILTPQTTYMANSGVFSCSVLELVLMIVTAVIGLVTAIVASFSYKAAAICGTIACICFGYPLGFLAVAMPSYQGPIILALVLTILLVAVLLVLYRTRVIKVTQKFRGFVFAVAITVLLGALFLFILHLIPATSSSVSWIMNNPVISIVFGVLGVMLACLFLLCDFNAIETAVTEKVDKKYENILAFSLAFSVIYLYFKILQLILRIMETRN